MRVILAGAFVSAFVISVLLVPVIRKAAGKWGLVDHPGGRKKHAGAVPLGGGIAILLAACLPVLAAGVLSAVWRANPSLFTIPSSLHEDAALAAARLPLLLKVLAGGLAIGALGLWDDARKLKPGVKLAGQFIIAVAVALIPEVRIRLVSPVPAAWVQVALTSVWIVLMVNCFNLLDNMDGQSGLVGFLTGGALLVLALQTGQYFIAGLLLALLGAVLGFLLFNFPPASIFMGDMGSMFVGYTLAVATTLTAFLTPQAMSPFFPVLVPLVIFAVPLYDTISVLVIRLHGGRALFKADRSHFSHRLMRLGMGDRMVLLTVALTVVATSLGATIPYGSSTWRVFIPAIQALAVILVIIQLELVSARKHKPEPKE